MIAKWTLRRNRMYGLLNIGSLVLGLIAWALPIAAAVSRKSRPGLSAASFALCAASLAMQLFYNQHLVALRDWAAIEDTHRAVCLAAAALLAGTVLLNALQWLRHR